MEILDIKEYLGNGEIFPILAESMYMPTKERLNARVEKYMNNSRIIALGVREDNKFCGILIMEDKEGNELHILDVAVNFYRKVGFKVKSLGEKYPGIIRYECKY